MNALAHQSSGTRVPRRSILLPRAVRLLGLAMGATAGVMVALQHLADRIG